MRYAVKIFFGLALVAGLGWAARHHASAACEMGGVLGKYSPQAANWFREAASDPFLESKLDRAPIQASLRQFQRAAAIVRGDYGLLRLSIDTKNQLAALAGADAGEERAQAIMRLNPNELTARCGEEEGIQAAAFAAQVLVAREEWQEAKRQAAKDKVLFAADLEIYCQLQELSEELETVMRASAQRCETRKKSGQQCGPQMNQALSKEIEDLGVKKEFNFTKLRRKWPKKVLELLKCASVSA